jgi:hypothetical protein
MPEAEPAGSATPARLEERPEPPAVSTFARPAEGFLLSDIERSRDYRKEYYKYSIGLATSLLAFTLVFQPTLKTAPENVWMEFIGWVGLGVAAAAGVRLHLVWARFFITFRDFDNKGDRAGGETARDSLTTRRRVLEAILMIGLLVGVAGVIGFTSTNLHNVAPKSVG